MIEAFDSNRTNIHTYDNVCVTKIKYSIFNVQDYIVLYNNVVLPIICEVWHLLKCGNHLHNRIISLRGEVCERKTSLIPPFLIEVPVPSQENERSYI
jgi:hypothetical protein